MNSLTEDDKNRISKMLENLSGELKSFKVKQTKQFKKEGLDKLSEYSELVNQYRRFVSPRKVSGKIVDKAKDKFYYETEHFIGAIVERQQLFNKETIKYLSKMEKEIKAIKDKLAN